MRRWRRHFFMGMCAVFPLGKALGKPWKGRASSLEPRDRLSSPETALFRTPVLGAPRAARSPRIQGTGAAFRPVAARSLPLLGTGDSAPRWTRSGGPCAPPWPPSSSAPTLSPVPGSRRGGGCRRPAGARSPSLQLRSRAHRLAGARLQLNLAAAAAPGAGTRPGYPKVSSRRAAAPGS